MRLRACLLVAALCACLPGCYSKATGHQGQLTFAYGSGVEVENFVKPIAPGAKLEVVAFANGTEDELVITGARSSRPGVLAVESVHERSVTVKAGEPGTAELEITVRDAAGNTLVDKTFLHVATPTIHRLEHACTEQREAVYVAGEQVSIHHGLATSNGRPVIGVGYVPLRVEPPTALELIAQPQDSPVYVFRAGRATRAVSIRSLVDDGVLSARVVDRGELQEATLDCAGDDCRMIEGEAQYVVARVRFGEVPVCNQTALTKARSLTPDICSVTATLEDDDGTESNREQLARVTGLKLGICRYEVTLPELNGGRGIRLAGEAKIGRLHFPGEGGTSEVRALLERDGFRLHLAALWWLLPRVLALAWFAYSRHRDALPVGRARGK